MTDVVIKVTFVRQTESDLDAEPRTVWLATNPVLDFQDDEDGEETDFELGVYTTDDWFEDPEVEKMFITKVEVFKSDNRRKPVQVHEFEPALEQENSGMTIVVALALHDSEENTLFL